jgi:pimeloyl-ACP methyl ester carboxylesterase
LETTIQEGFIQFRGYKTWYRIVGAGEELGKLPLICLHGGPGATHDYFGSLEAFTATGRGVVLYDQLGWGNSDHVSGSISMDGKPVCRGVRCWVQPISAVGKTRQLWLNGW